jgi:small subunit ribosomal protein S1
MSEDPKNPNPTETVDMPEQDAQASAEIADQNETPAQDVSEMTSAEPVAETEPVAEADEPAGDAGAPDAEGAAESADEKESILDRVKHVAEDLVDAAADAASSVAERVGEAVSGAVSSAVHAVAGDGESKLTSVDSVDALREGANRGGRLGYTGEIVGRTVTLDELAKLEREMAADEDGYPASDDELLELYEGSMANVTEGEIITGRIVSMTDKEIVVDIGFKSDGVVAKNEFDRVLEIGEEVDVYVDRLEDRRGQLMLSKTKADDLLRWRRIEDAFETGGVLEGEIVRRIKGGMIVNLLGAEAFLPGSQVDVRPVRDFDTYLGKTMEFKVVKTNPQNGNVVVSHKALIEKDLMAQRQQILETLEVGQVLEGQVKNIVNFGVFIDLGGVDGLLHITDLSWGRVGHPSEVIELDQKLNIVVLDYDKERQRISLGYKQLQPHPWDGITERYAEGQEVEGRVVSITDSWRRASKGSSTSPRCPGRSTSSTPPRRCSSARWSPSRFSRSTRTTRRSRWA